MKIINWIRYKICSIANQYNSIDKDILIKDSVYISGSTVQGDVIIADNCKIYKSHIEGNICIGCYTSLWGPNIFIMGKLHGIKIGNFCSIARGVSIQEDYHNPNRVTTYFLERNLLDIPPREDAIISKGKIVIGNDVWIGSGAQILSGINIGHGAIVGAGAVITKDIPPYAIVGGNPAKILKFRFDKSKIDELLVLAWWDWSVEKIKKNQYFLLSIEKNRILDDI